MQPLNFKPVDRGQLFFGQYEYSICLMMSEASCLRAKTYEELLGFIKWRNDSRTSLSASYREQIKGAKMDNLFDMWNLLDAHRADIKYTVSYDRLYVYARDPALLATIAHRDYVWHGAGQRAMVTLPQGVVLKKDPVFRYRTYFRDVVLQPERKDLLAQFLIGRVGTTFGFTSGFKIHLASKNRLWLERHHYVEHNDLMDLTMLSLVCAGTIRKTMPIQAK